MKAPRVPWTPEPLAALQARYPAAIATIYDQRAVEQWRSPAPSGQPACVFDSLDGLRLIISRERTPEPENWIILHVSASLSEPVLEAHEAIITCPSHSLRIQAFEGLAKARFAAISGDQRALTLIGWSGSITHWMIRT